ncbi:hypothetical protein C4569_03955 [Candidatus Parcubacteria bacterium]|nr:MAG: hypothetical protein C4569_03955 [Candidatus Parcubacteria bacterium]
MYATDISNWTGIDEIACALYWKIHDETAGFTWEINIHETKEGFGSFRVIKARSARLGLYIVFYLIEDPWADLKMYFEVGNKSYSCTRQPFEKSEWLRQIAQFFSDSYKKKLEELNEQKLKNGREQKEKEIQLEKDLKEELLAQLKEEPNHL